jgi:hypothetical protein
MIVNYRLRCAPGILHVFLNQRVMIAAEAPRPAEASLQPFSGLFISRPWADLPRLRRLSLGIQLVNSHGPGFPISD